MSSYYILDSNRNVREATHEEWEAFFKSRARIVSQEKIGGHLVSTVFIGNYHKFETMIFHPEERDDGTVKECSDGIAYAMSNTWEEALRHHGEAAQTIQGIGNRAVKCETCGFV